MRMRRQRPITYAKGDLVKRKESGGHVMGVVELSTDGQTIIGGYRTPDGVEHREPWHVSLIKMVDVGL